MNENPLVQDFWNPFIILQWSLRSSCSVCRSRHPWNQWIYLFVFIAAPYLIISNVSELCWAWGQDGWGRQSSSCGGLTKWQVFLMLLFSLVIWGSVGIPNFIEKETDTQISRWNPQGCLARKCWNWDLKQVHVVQNLCLSSPICWSPKMSGKCTLSAVILNLRESEQGHKQPELLPVWVLMLKDGWMALAWDSWMGPFSAWPINMSKGGMGGQERQQNRSLGSMLARRGGCFSEPQST